MACKNPHAQDNSVVERRLRPIYEWLDSGNNKKALQECEKVLKKTPQLQCAKALKALALLRNGKETDCTNILDGLTTEKPCDDATLQAMTLCYRELQQLNKIHPLYETAVKVEPSNEELHTHLFMAYVRISDFKAQQQAAMTLYKLKPKNPYYCWAVMSIILQATRGPGASDDKKRNLLLSLAERMIDKLVVDNKLEAEQEVQLYVMILELQGKFEHALKIIESPLGDKLLNGTVATNKLPYLIKLQKWNEVNVLCKKILVENVDKWDIWRQYLESVLEIMAVESGHINNHIGQNEMETVDDTPEKAHEFICSLVENGPDNGYLLRGPYLARFELLKRLSDRGLDTSDLLGETIELFIEYFRTFGHKPCCVTDLRGYLSLLDGEKKSDLSSRLMKDVGISSTSVPQTEQQMQRHICALQLSRLCGNHRNFSEDHLKALVTALSLHYQHGYQTYGMYLLSTDQGPSDPYALLAAHLLYDLAQTSKKSEPIVLALVLLENLLKNSPSNFHAKLLCARLYHTLGGAIGAQLMFDSLDIKHLQLDSMGYIHCARLPSTGLYNLPLGHYEGTLKFFSSNYKDSSDHLTFSYKFGSFIKLDEFMDFRERLNNSFHNALVTVERIFLSLMVVNSLDNLYTLDILAIFWDNLRNNSDYSVYQSWDPKRISGPPEEHPDMKLLFEQDMNLLKLRNQILLAVQSTINITKSTDGTRDKYLEDLNQVLRVWENMYTNIPATNLIPLRQDLVTYPLPSRLHISLNLQHPQFIRQFFRLIEPVIEEDVERTTELTEIIHKTLAQLLQFTDEKVASQKSSQDCYWDKRTVIEEVVNVCEIICISSIVCALCLQLVKPIQSKKTKRKPESKVREVLLEFGGNLRGHLNKFDQIVDGWAPSEEVELADQLSALNLANDSHANVLENLKNSHVVSTKDLSMVVRSKVKLLDGVLG